MPDYTIRAPRGIEEFEGLAGVFQEVFSLADRATPPAWLMEDTTNAGGLTLGLWCGEEPVGFSYAFAGLDDAGPYLYSTGLGVLPGHRSQKQALEMKVAQRKIALERGYERMKWTYSALRAVNAHIYLSRLGGIGSKYVIDNRGSLDDDWVTEGGIPLDEFVVDWNLESARVVSRLNGSGASQLKDVPRITSCAGAGPARVLERIEDGPYSDRVACEVPSDFQYLASNAPEIAHDWRQKTRPVFADLMNVGFMLTECVMDEDGSSVYLFEKNGGSAR